MVIADSLALRVRQFEAKSFEYAYAAMPVPRTIAAYGLAEIVEQSDNCDAVGREEPSAGSHMVIYLNGVCSEPAVLLVVAVTSAPEVAGGLKICDYGFDAGASGSTEDSQDAVFAGDHILLVYDIYCRFERLLRHAAKKMQMASFLP